MVLHGMRIKVKDVLSQPTKADKEQECNMHGGIEAVRTSTKTPGLPDDLQLLRQRHRMVHKTDAEDKKATSSEMARELSQAMGSASLGTPVNLRPNRPMYSPQQNAPEIEKQLATLGLDRFEGDYIELDAGEHEAFLQEVATNMKEPGHALKALADDFKNRDTVYKHLGAEMRVQESVVKLANALSQRFFGHLPGYWEDQTGEIHQCSAAGDVFASRGLTYVKQDTTEPDVPDAPKPELPVPFDGTSMATPVQTVPSQGSQTHDPRQDKQNAWIGQNKPDIINNYFEGKTLPKSGMTWPQVNLSFEVKPKSNYDCTHSLILRIQRYQVNQIKHSSATGEVLTLTICGDIVRVWYGNPQRYGSTRGFSLHDPNHFYEIVKIFALFSGPVSNHLPQWKPRAGPKGRLSMLSSSGEAFSLELKDIGLLDSRFDMFGRRTAVWCASIAQNDSLSGDQKSPAIELEKGEQLVIKTSWHIPRLRHHEHNVYKDIERRERELEEQKGFERDREVEIPSLVGMMSDEHHNAESLECIGDQPLSQWKTRPVRINPLRRDGDTEYAQFTILITKCRRAVPIGRLDWNEWELIELYRKLFKNLKHLALLGVHYRDLNMGNILCDATKQFCLLADLDFARIGKLRRGEIDNNNPATMLETSLDDCVSGNRLFMSGHVQDSLERRGKLALARLTLAAAERIYETKLKTAGSVPITVFDDRRRRLRKKVADIEQEMAMNQHRFKDDLESAMYTMFWLAAEKSALNDGLICGPLFPFAEMDDRKTKQLIWDCSDDYTPGLGIYSEDWCEFVASLCAKISDSQSLPFDDTSAEELSDGQEKTYDILDAMMKGFVEEQKSRPSKQ